MFSAVRRRPTYANVAMTLALIFAMTGGAYAAGKILIASTKQIKPSVLKQLQGKAGKTGPAGTLGAQGPQGPAGANGKDGATGTNGVSVASSNEPKGANCPEGGSRFTAANGVSYACNGVKGSKGEPWTPNGTLPSKATEKGAWAFGPVAKTALPAVEEQLAVASFTIPLKATLNASQVHYLNPKGKEVVLEGELIEKTSTACTGSAAEPSAEAGNFCVYAAEESGAVSFDGFISDPAAPSPAPSEGAGTTGAVLF